MLDFKKKLWIIRQKEKGKLVDSQIAIAQNTTRRHVQRLWTAYHTYGLDGLCDKPIGRKIDAIPVHVQDKILALRRKKHGIRRIEGLLYQEGISISKRKITRVLKQYNLHTPSPEKGRRYSYVRWERSHSNSLWQTDYCWIEPLGCWITGWLDDHSRLIVSADYVKEATTENAIKLFEKAAGNYGLPRETLSDRGTQYYNATGETCYFLEHMKARGVKHIYASIKKPTTCGKMERWWRTHNDERWGFPSLQRFLQYYNCERPHMSLNWRTPYEVWKRDLKV